MRAAMPILASQHFAGNKLCRGLAGRKLEQLLASDQPQEYALVADRRVAVTTTSGGGSTHVGGGTTAVQWVDRAGLAALELSHAGGEQLQLGPQAQGQGQAVPVYFLGEDLTRRTLRMAVDVTGAPAGWAERHQIRLQVKGVAAGAGWAGGRTIQQARESRRRSDGSECRMLCYTPLPMQHRILPHPPVYWNEHTAHTATPLLAAGPALADAPAGPC